MNTSILNSIPAGSTILIDGQVDFCRISSFIEGDELAQYNRRSPARIKRTRPFTVIRIANPRPFRLQADIEMAARLIDGLLFRSRDYQQLIEINSNAAADPSKRRLPTLYANQGNAIKGEYIMAAVPPEPGREIEPGSNVTLVLRVYGTPYGNNGINLDSVMIQDNPPRFFKAKRSSTEDELEAMGIRFV